MYKEFESGNCLGFCCFKGFVSLELPLFLVDCQEKSIVHLMADAASANVIKAGYQCHGHAMPNANDLPIRRTPLSSTRECQSRPANLWQPQFHVAMYPSSPELHVLQTQTAIAPRIPTDPTT